LKKINKKYLYIVLTIAAMLAICSFIPIQSNVTESIQFSTNSDALFRQLLRDSSWINWWPGKVEFINQKQTFANENFLYSNENILSNSFTLKTTSSYLNTVSFLQIIPEASNIVTVRLSASIDLPINPISRLAILFKSVALRASFKSILVSLSSYFTSTKHLYDVDIKETTVAFEYVTTQSKEFNKYPSVSEIYIMIEHLRNYIKKNQAEEKGYPMLYVNSFGGKQFFVQVAIPINIQLSPSEGIKSKRLLKGGQILSTEIIGGRSKIRNAIKQIEFYIQDNQHSTVAIPFEYLITNRSQEPDSSKWVTCIYYPVILKSQ
jgi:effector-binding domain-containing protein